VLHTMDGQTIGKMLMGARVVGADGAPLPLGAALLRYVAYFVSAAPLAMGFIMAGLRRDKRALHDLIAGSRVDRIRARPRARAAVLFDAGLAFEVHELLEPYWVRAHGDEREALQGLIQIAVGYQHLANGNLAGARALLDDGTTRTRGRSVAGIDCDAFARAAR